MSGTTFSLDQADEEVLNYEISDEALETAAGTGTGKEEARNYTICFCTYSHMCRSWQPAYWMKKFNSYDSPSSFSAEFGLPLE
jgi:hypothetical protein